MRRAAPLAIVVGACLVYGCSTMKPHGSNHPGITEMNPNAAVRTYSGSATLVARTLADVMGDDSIIVNVAMTPDTKSKEFRNFSRADREALGISNYELANDVNYEIKARSRDGHPITVAVRLKGDSGSEASILYGVAGDLALSRELLDKTEAALTKPAKDADVSKTIGSKSTNGNASTR